MARILGGFSSYSADEITPLLSSMRNGAWYCLCKPEVLVTESRSPTGPPANSESAPCNADYYEATDEQD